MRHVSSLVGLCVDVGIVRVGTALVPKWPAVFMCLSNGGEPLQNPLDTCVTSRLSYCRGPLSSVCVCTHIKDMPRAFFSFVYFECVAIRRLFFLPQLTLDCSAALPVTSRSAAQFSSEPKPNRQLMDGCEVGGLCGREGDRLSN